MLKRYSRSSTMSLCFTIGGSQPPRLLVITRTNMSRTAVNAIGPNLYQEILSIIDGIFSQCTLKIFVCATCQIKKINSRTLNKYFFFHNLDWKLYAQHYWDQADHFKPISAIYKLYKLEQIVSLVFQFLHLRKGYSIGSTAFRKD